MDFGALQGVRSKRRERMVPVPARNSPTANLQDYSIFDVDGFSDIPPSDGKSWWT